MTRSRSRRRILAAAVPTLLGGCLVESQANSAARADASTAQADAGGDGSAENGADGDGSDDDGSDDDGSSGDGTADADEAATGSTSPAPAGIAVETVSIDRIIGSIHLSQIVVDVTVRNAGPETYGSVELRVDAFYTPSADDRTYHPPRVDERTAVGRRYVDREFDGFESGTRTFENVVVRYDADADANGSTDPADFDFTAAIRGADAL